MYACSLLAGFPTQLVNPITAEGISMAGFSGYTLICNTSREPDLPPSSTLAVQWFDPRGNVLTNGTMFTILGAGLTTDTILISRLIFNTLYTSQIGVYTCRTLQTIPGTVVNHPESLIFPVQVKCELSIIEIHKINHSFVHTVPAPISPLTFHRSRNSTLNVGTSFSLTCIIAPNTTGVDTNVMVQSSITGPGISGTSRVSVSQPMSTGGSAYETTVTFHHLLEADAGTYSCSAIVTSSHPSLIASDSISGSEFINVRRKLAIALHIFSFIYVYMFLSRQLSMLPW